jgi:hypothetical protein
MRELKKKHKFKRPVFSAFVSLLKQRNKKTGLSDRLITDSSRRHTTESTPTDHEELYFFRQAMTEIL